MEKLNFPRVGETMYHEKLENGLNVFVFPKPAFQKGYAFFATNYGGMDMRFCLDGEWHNTPAGVAHYLEHKMFDTQEGNALQELAANGASPNAFTSNAITGYYFDSTEKFEENLRILLSFVSIPWFTQESVDKEQGIIGQEIGMIEDDPEWKVFINLMAALYKHHPVRVSVAGSVESISHITADTLYACHKAFYDPANMVLCVAGPVEPERICEVAREILPKEAGPIAAKDYGEKEQLQAAQSLVEERMTVSAPLFQLGYKGDAPVNGEERLRQQLVGELALEALLGNSTPLYAKLYREGLINAEFAYGYECYPGCAFLMAGGESKDPEAVRAAVAEERDRIGREGVDSALWERVKKGVYGNKVRGLNSFENLCVGQAQSFFAGSDFLRFAEIFDSITKQEAEELIGDWVTEERTALSVVRAKEAT
ncbi:insulinase family protein [Pseudoflavonifractor sp. 60]|uniref:EF-P 5-aminopentanol modification-associated protein YfmH n=1 Tax=Pseudoflavonifractor sp. 60 TaxID=2304576 RepID=UPI00136F7E92|nr:pitrilysin family protein [Pseudoflavonifractor sp. 60]NBI66232.1 insulinase family protein [Pseudoflavonifractor sp. 60]